MHVASIGWLKYLGWWSGAIEYEVLISVSVNDNKSVTGV
jgi:hypothetical protein